MWRLSSVIIKSSNWKPPIWLFISLLYKTLLGTTSLVPMVPLWYWQCIVLFSTDKHNVEQIQSSVHHVQDGLGKKLILYLVRRKNSARCSAVVDRIKKQTIEKSCLLVKTAFCYWSFVEKREGRGVSGGWAGWAIAHPDFGRIEGAARKQQCAHRIMYYLPTQI